MSRSARSFWPSWDYPWLITATGTARFAAAMGYRAEVGYAVGSVFDLTKALLPVALLILFTRRAFWFFAIIGSAWLGLVAYSCLATHATVTSAIAAIERTGAWKMEDRANAKAELAQIEERIGALVQPQIPRPSDTVRAALLSEKVPPGVWRDSQECQSIRESRYFQMACAKVLELRRELAAAEDYERLNARARELRQDLRHHRLSPPRTRFRRRSRPRSAACCRLDGRVGVALLLTFVVEIMSCFGFAALRALREGQRSDLISRGGEQPRPEIGEEGASGMNGRSIGEEVQVLPSAPDLIAPEGPEAQSAPDSRQVRDPANAGEGRTKRSEPPSTVLPPPSAGISDGVSPIPPRVIPPSSGRSPIPRWVSRP